MNRADSETRIFQPFPSMNVDTFGSAVPNAAAVARHESVFISGLA
jgi:hypothetical protein